MPKKREDVRQEHGPSELEQSLIKEKTRLLSQVQGLRKRLGEESVLVESISNRLIEFGTMPAINPAPRLVPKKTVYERPLVAVLNIADPHMEEVVDPAETEGLLEWNFERFLRCAWHTSKTAVEIVEIIRAKHQVDELHIFWLGDMVTGEIHPDVYFSNAFYLPDALTAGPWYWAQVVRELAAHFDKVTCTCVPGNHGRMDIKPTSKRRVGRNWDTAMYQLTALFTKDLDNVVWQIPRSPKAVVEINGWYFLIQHGDQVAMHGGTTPYYGMQRQRSAELAKRMGFRVRDIEQQLKKGLLFDYDVRGHLHQYATTEERTLICPSMMGSNEWALSKTFSHAWPGQRLFFVDEEHGIAGDWRINFVEIGEHRFELLPNWEV
jgi:hypothetical protein